MGAPAGVEALEKEKLRGGFLRAAQAITLFEGYCYTL